MRRLTVGMILIMIILLSACKPQDENASNVEVSTTSTEVQESSSSDALQEAEELQIYWQTPVEDYEVVLRDGMVENTMEVWVHKGDEEWSILAYDRTNDYRVPGDITIDTFQGIMGHNGFCIHECYNMGSQVIVCVTNYYAMEEEPVHLADTWTCLNSREDAKTPNVYSVDLDGDGITELLCNVRWLADGAVDSKIFHWDGETVYTLGGTDIMLAEKPDIEIYGVGSVGAKYLPGKNKMLAWYWDNQTEGFIEKEYDIDLSKVKMWEYK